MLFDAQHIMEGLHDRDLLSEIILGYVSKMTKVIADPSIPFDKQEGSYLNKVLNI